MESDFEDFPYHPDFPVLRFPALLRPDDDSKEKQDVGTVSGKPSRVHRWGKKAQRFFNLYYSFWAQGGSQLRRDANLTRSRKTLPASLMGENCVWDFLKWKEHTGVCFSGLRLSCGWFYQRVYLSFWLYYFNITLCSGVFWELIQGVSKNTTSM